MLQVVLERGSSYKPIPGHTWRALFYDSVTGVHASESGGSPWEALAWCLVDWQEKQHGMVSPARNMNDTPAGVLARLSALGPRVQERGFVDRAEDARPLKGAIDNRGRLVHVDSLSSAPKSPAVVGGSLALLVRNDSASASTDVGATFSLAPSIPKSAAARRARTKQTARKK